MKAKLLLYSTVFLLGSLCGCSSSTRGRLDHDPTNYARQIKERVLEFVRESKQNPRGVRLGASILLETLEVHPSQPIGPHGPTYATMTQLCRGFVETTKRSPAPVAPAKFLQDMATLAKQLPG
jgi:hypothetical protein